MPIDPYHLDRNRRKPRKDPGDGLPSKATGWTVFLVGIVALGVLFAIAYDNPGFRPIYAIGTAVLFAIAMFLGAVHTGTRDGVLGLFFFLQRPMSSLDPDSRSKSPVIIALIWLLGLAIISNGVLMMIVVSKGP